MNNQIESMPNWEYEFYSEMSNFEILQLQAIQLDNTNSIVTIFMSALFAYFMLSQFFAAKLSKSQTIMITVVYSFFMIYEVILMGLGLENIFSLQLYVSSVSGDVGQVPNLLIFMVLPFISGIAWLISIVYMWTSSRKK